jgi:hypothetical protein
LVEYYPHTIYYPKDEVEKKWRNGDLALVESRLLDFIRRHAMIIIEIAQDESENPTSDEYLDAMSMLLLSKGTIHPPSEMADIIREINNEIWYQGEQGERDSKKISELWEHKYAFQWREARLFEATIVLEHIAPTAIKTLLDTVASMTS